MKILFTLALVFFTSLFAIAQIKVKTSNSSLSLRSEPTTSSNVLYSLPNETELLYANDWSEGWIKVRHSSSYNNIDPPSDNDEVYDYSGWVNAAFVETKMFKSTILDTMSWQDETDGYFNGIYGVDGLLGINSYDEQSTKFKVKIKGVSYTLTMSEDDGKYFRFEHPQLKIEFFGAETYLEYESSESKGVLRVEFNGKVEYIYAAHGAGS